MKQDNLTHKKNILIIGAGAVGTVYGYFLAKQHHVTFYVRDKYVAQLSQGYRIDLLNKKNKPTETVTDFSVVSDKCIAQKQLATQHSDSNAAPHWDVVIITLSTTALPKFDISPINFTGSTVVLLSPGADDLAVLQQKFAQSEHNQPAHMVTGMISLISYIVPETDKNNLIHTKVYFAPLAPMPFANVPVGTDGTVAKKAGAAKEVASLYKAAGMSAKVVQNTFKTALYPNAFLTMFVLALQAADWQFASLKQSSKVVQLMINSIKECNRGVQKVHQLPYPFQNHILSKSMIKLGLSIAPRFFPFDIEAYLKLHFTKVKEQSYVHAQSYMELCQQNNMSCDAVKELLALAQQAA